MFAYTKIMQAMSGAVAVVTDAYFNLVTLLLNTSSTNGAQNNTFLDSSTNNFTITRNGNTTQGTFSPFSQTGWSNYFDGATNSYLALPSNTAFAFGTGAYTVEGWLYQTARSTNEALFFGADGVSGFLSYITNTGAVNSGSITGSAGDIPLNTWCHVAYVRSSTGTNDTKIYVNGVVKATGTDATNWTNSGDPRIGMLTANTNYAIKGYISNFRIVKGTAVYTSAFTPPTTPLTAISGTSVLTCQSNRFLDISTNAFTVTATGTMSVQAFSPFLPTAAYDASVVGGSGYFDGTGDSLSIADNVALEPGTGDFTWESWIYNATAVGSLNMYTDQTGGGLAIYRNSSGNLVVESDGVAGIVTSASVVSSYQWVYVAVTRSGSTARIFFNGVLDASATNTTNIAGTSAIFIGTNPGGSFPITGYLSGLRFVKGTALYTANFSVPTAPPTAISGTQLLLNFTNSGIFDSAAKNVLETVGNAQVSTTQAKFGTTSMAFDGTGDNLKSKLTNAIGSGDYTIEGFFYASGTGIQYLFDMRETSQYIGAYIIGSTTTLYVNFGTTLDIVASSSFALNTWNHMAFVRSGSGTNNTSVFLNGSRVYQRTDTTDYSIVPNLFVACENSGNYYLNGYVDEFRITKGYARYSGSTYTVPTAAFPLQ